MYAILQIPLFPLQAGLRQMRPKPRAPVAVVDDSGEQSRILSVDKVAQGFGVNPGMRPPQALARCGELTLITRSESAETEAGRMLVLLAQTLSPRVEASESGLVTVDLRGTREAATRARCEALVEQFRELGLHICIGIADTPDHARWAAHFARPIQQVRSVDAFLKHVPLAVAQVPEEIADILEGWGIRHLAALKRLPREEVGARLGQRGIDLWDAVAGRRVRLLKTVETEPRFERSQALEFRIESQEALLFLLKRFVDALAVELEVAHAAAFILKLRFKLEDDRILRKTIEVPEPSGRARTLFRILETALEGLQVPGAIIAVGLKLETTEARVRQGDLFAVAMEDAAGFAETADRIAALVGPGRSGSPRLNSSWKPDAFRIEKLDTEIHDTPATAPADASEGECEREGPLLGLPLARLRPPQAVRVFLENGQPALIEDSTYGGLIFRRSGPWRHSGGWWDTAGVWAREEWDVAMKNGALYRIFREGGAWYLEGTYG